MAERIYLDTREPTELPKIISEITVKNKLTANKIISAALHVKNMLEQRKSAKEAQKNASERQMQDITRMMLESPNGITKGDILAAGESINLSSTIQKLKAYLAHINIYTLKKHQVKKEMLYFLDPIRTETPADQ